MAKNLDGGCVMTPREFEKQRLEKALGVYIHPKTDMTTALSILATAAEALKDRYTYLNNKHDTLTSECNAMWDTGITWKEL